MEKSLKLWSLLSRVNDKIIFGVFFYRLLTKARLQSNIIFSAYLRSKIMFSLNFLLFSGNKTSLII